MDLGSWWRRLRGRGTARAEDTAPRSPARRVEDETGVLRVTPDTPTVVLDALEPSPTVAVPAPAPASDLSPPPATRSDGPPLEERRIAGVLVAVEGEFRGRAWALGEGPNRLGREYGCEICLPTERLAPRHASLELRGGRFHVEMLADEEFTLDGEPMRSGVLRDGATLRVGMTTFRFRSIVDP